MQDKIDEITRLTDLWFKCLDYHKDRDCHWYIHQIWSYGDEPYWEVQHYGYVYKEVSIRCETFEEALLNLILTIKDAFKEEVAHAEQVINDPSEWDVGDTENAELIIKLLKPEIKEAKDA